MVLHNASLLLQQFQRPKGQNMCQSAIYLGGALSCVESGSTGPCDLSWFFGRWHGPTAFDDAPKIPIREHWLYGEPQFCVDYLSLEMWRNGAGNDSHYEAPATIILRKQLTWEVSEDQSARLGRYP
jgi:hypothetical protein